MIVTPSAASPLDRADASTSVTSNVSAVSWAAVFAGGVTAAAFTIMLVIFGTGLGLGSVSPWQGQGLSATKFTVLAAIWLIITQWISSGFGGYIAGRLRTKWVAVHTDEVFFRDTAHGFLSWALATIMLAVLLAGLSTSVTTAGSQVAATTAVAANQNNYYINLLFRENANPLASVNGAAAGAANGSATGGATGDQSVLAPTTTTPPAPASPNPLSLNEAKAQAATILTHDLPSGAIPTADSAYLVQLVSTQTKLAPADAQERVTDVVNQAQSAIAKAKEIADESRKASSATAIYIAISMLIGAFIASVAAAIGGRLRDDL